MFAQIFINRLKCLLRDRETVFWTVAFPLVLSVFFNLAFSNLDKSETFNPVNVAVVNDENYQNNIFFKAALNEVSKGDDRLFNLMEVTEEEAERLLSSNSIDGYITVGSSLKLIVGKSGINQNIIKSFIDNYLHTFSTVNNILVKNPAGSRALFENLSQRVSYTREVSPSSAAPNNVLNYFYTLIAMACFYGCFWGMREITDIQADLSSLAARINTAPVHKMKAFIYSLCASLLIHLVEMAILLSFLRFVLNVDFGSRTGYVILIVILGSIAGLSFGAFVSALVKKSEGFKIGIMIGATMIGSFLAGMMYQNMKYIVAKKVPLLSYLNPVNLLTDAFYCLYYYDTLKRYAINMGLLTIFIIVFWTGTYLVIRRRKYASI